METEKIVCCDRGNNDAIAAAIMASGRRENNNDALVASILAGRNNDDNAMWPMMAMGGMGMNQWMNNPFAYMMMMAWMRNFNGGWGDGNGQNAQNIELQNQIQSLRSQLQDNQNTQLLRDAIGDGFNRNDFALSQLSQNLNVDFNTLQKCCCDVQAAIQSVAGQVGYSAERVINAANMGDLNIITQLKDCCCNIRESIADFKGDMQLQMCQQTGTLKDGQRDITAALTQGFSTLGFQLQQDKCDLINNQNANTQRIVDTLRDHWDREKDLKIQDLKFENSQLKQNNLIIARTGGYNNGCCNGSQYNEGF